MRDSAQSTVFYQEFWREEAPKPSLRKHLRKISALFSCIYQGFRLYLQDKSSNLIKQIMRMKKLFTLAASLFCALTINAQTSLVFTGNEPSELNGATLTSSLEGFSLSIVDANGKVAIDANKARFGTADSYVMYDHRLKTGGKSSSSNNMTLSIPADGTLQVCVRSASSSALDRSLVLTQNDAELYNKVVRDEDLIEVPGDDGTTFKVYPVVSVNVKAGTVSVTYPTGSINFYAFTFVPTKTGIRNVTESVASKSGITYNLAGQRVAPNYKGVVIRDGKKFVNR
jgi:hypothetical protein